MTERLRRIAPGAMTDEQAAIYQKFASGRRVAAGTSFSLVHPDGGLIGPPAAWILSPPLGAVLEQLGAVMRYGLQLSDRSREIAILLVAFGRDSAFEIHAHRQAGLAAGLTDAEIEALSDRRPPQFADDEERIVFAATLALLDRNTLDDAEFSTATQMLGERRLFELTALIGYYEFLATQISVFGLTPPV